MTKILPGTYRHSFTLQYLYKHLSSFVPPELFPGSSDSNKPACNAGDPGWVPVLGRSPGERNGNPLQCSCLGNPRDRGAWRSVVHGVAKSRTWLSDLGPSASPCEKASIVACSLRPSHAAAVPKGWLSNLSFSYTRCFVIFL